MTCLDPNTNKLAAVRLLIADTEIPYILSDDDVRYFLSLNNQNPMRAARLAAQSILMRFSQMVEESTGPLSFNGAQAAREYRESLKMFLNDPNFSVSINTAVPYAGGISVKDVEANLANPDNIVPSTTRSILSESDDYPSAYAEDNPFYPRLRPRDDTYSV